MDDEGEPRPPPAEPAEGALAACVRETLRLYLDQMAGHEVSGLYRFVLDEVERPLFETVLEYTKGNQTLAAQMLGLSRSTLRKKLKGGDG